MPMTFQTYIKYSFAALLAVTAACNSDGVGAPARDVTSIFWALQFNHTAVTMAVGEVLQVAATPVTVNGTPITTLPKPVYHSDDTTKVKIDSTGKMTAVDQADGVVITATLSDASEQLTNVDTVFVNVTPTHQTIVSFTMQPLDSTTLAVGEFKDLPVRVRDPDGNSIDNLRIIYTSSDPTRALIDRFYAFMRPIDVGTVTLYAQTTSYGVTYTDSVRMTLTYPFSARIAIQPIDDIAGSPPYFVQPLINIQRGGTVTWNNSTTFPVDVTFDDPSNIPDGNIPSVVPDSREGARTFPVAGTYPYHSVKYGSSGKIVVH